MATLNAAVNDCLSSFGLADVSAATFALGLPLVLLVWSAVRRETSMVRLLNLYWKVASLMAISMLLLTSQQPLGYMTALIAPLLMVVSVWFWVDLNEELGDLPAWRRCR